MKCPRCWAEKAYVHPMPGWKGVLLDCLLLTRMKCRHCYHKFVIPWFLTLGKQVTPPEPKPASCREEEAPTIAKYARPGIAPTRRRGQWDQGRRGAKAA